MSLHFFVVPAVQPQAAAAELNAFCQAHRVVQLERQFVADGANSYWAVCVTLTSGPGPLPEALKLSGRSHAPNAVNSAARIDYRHVLSEADFQVFAALRSLRKNLAEQEGVPVFAVFSNEQLASMARERCSSLAALARIEGVGPSRVERYGAVFLRALGDFSAVASVE